MMKNSEIRELTLGELHERLEETRNQYTRLKMNHAISPLENPQEIKYTRRDIARLLTEISKRERENSKQS